MLVVPVPADIGGRERHGVALQHEPEPTEAHDGCVLAAARADEDVAVRRTAQAEKAHEEARGQVAWLERSKGGQRRSLLQDAGQ